MKKLRITVDGKAYDVVVESFDEPSGSPAPSPAPTRRESSSIAAPVASSPAPSGGGSADPGAIISPLAGRVVSIDCAIGDSVAEGQTLVTLEAMKMNTLIHANAAGIVAKILVEPGDAVEEGQSLVVVQ